MLENNNNSESPRGRRICAYCATVMGPATTEQDTHGICNAECLAIFTKMTKEQQTDVRERLKKLNLEKKTE